MLEMALIFLAVSIHHIIVADDDIELPSDLQGVVYTDSSNWAFEVLKELKAMGYSIDYNKLDD